MGCLDNIISIKGCTQGESLSGLDLLDAPELSSNILEYAANEDTLSGAQLAKEKVALATKLVKTDLMLALTNNNIIPNLANRSYVTGEFRPATTISASAKMRGQTLYRPDNRRGNMRKLVINKIRIYPLADVAEATVKLLDASPGDGTGTQYTYTFALTANQVNEFEINKTIEGSYARVTMDGTDIPVASSYMTCFVGCGGKKPNDCGYVKSTIGDSDIGGREGYGIVLDFKCECDYDVLLCNLAEHYIGHLVWLKSRIVLLEAGINTDRYNSFFIYGKEEMLNTIKQLSADYNNRWYALMQTMPSTLKSFPDDCLVCNGAQWKTNI